MMSLKSPVSATAQSVRHGGIDPVLAKAVLAGLIRHPAEIARHVEVLGSLRLADDALAGLFEAVIDVLRKDYGGRVVKKPLGKSSRKTSSRG